MSTDTGTDTGTDTTDPGTLAERAARGAALLDEREPGWAARINADTLAMGSCVECILGQRKGHYLRGIRAIGAARLPLFWAVLHGFNLPGIPSDRSWEDLTDAWRAEIRKRVDTRAAS